METWDRDEPWNVSLPTGASKHQRWLALENRNMNYLGGLQQGAGKQYGWEGCGSDLCREWKAKLRKTYPYMSVPAPESELMLPLQGARGCRIMVIALTGVFNCLPLRWIYRGTEWPNSCLPHFSVKFSQFLQREAKTLLVLQRCRAPGHKTYKLSSIGWGVASSKKQKRTKCRYWEWNIHKKGVEEFSTSINVR